MAGHTSKLCAACQRLLTLVLHDRCPHDLQDKPRRPAVPMAVIGGSLSADCAPRDANYHMFYDACAAPAWQVSCCKCSLHSHAPADVQSSQSGAVSISVIGEACLSLPCSSSVAVQAL